MKQKWFLVIYLSGENMGSWALILSQLTVSQGLLK